MNDKIQTIDLREQYFRVSNRIFQLNLTIYEIGVYSAICRFVNNDTKMAYPSIQKIADMLNISKRQVVRSIKGLVEKNIIFKKGSKKEGIVNQYYLLTIHEDLKTLLTSDSQSPVTDSHTTSDSQSHLPVTHSHPKKTNIKRLNKKTNTDNKLSGKSIIDLYHSLLIDNNIIYKPNQHEYINFYNGYKKYINTDISHGDIEAVMKTWFDKQIGKWCGYKLGNFWGDIGKIQIQKNDKISNILKKYKGK